MSFFLESGMETAKIVRWMNHGRSVPSWSSHWHISPSSSFFYSVVETAKTIWWRASIHTRASTHWWPLSSTSCMVLISSRVVIGKSPDDVSWHFVFVRLSSLIFGWEWDGQCIYVYSRMLPKWTSLRRSYIPVVQSAFVDSMLQQTLLKHRLLHHKILIGY